METEKEDKKVKKSDETRQKIDWRNIGLKTLSTIVSGIVIAFVGLYIWKQQNMTTQQQKTYDTKIELLRQLTSDGLKMIYYSEFITRTKLEMALLYDNITDFFTQPNDGFENYKMQLMIQKENPILYDKFMQGLEFQSNFNSTLMMTGIIFNPDSTQYISLFYQFSDMALVDKVLPFSNQAIDKEKIVNEIRDEQRTLLIEILNDLYNQIQK